MDNNGNVPRFDPMTGEPLTNDATNSTADAVNNVENTVSNAGNVADNEVLNTTNTVDNAVNQQSQNFSQSFNQQPQGGFNQQPQGGFNQQPQGFNQQPQGFNQQPQGGNTYYNAAGEKIDTSAQAMNDYTAFMRGNDNRAAMNFKTTNGRTKKRGIALIVAAVLVVVVAVSAFAFKAQVVNAIKLHTLSPSKYFEWVMDKEYNKDKKQYMELYKYSYDVMKSDERGMEGSFKLEAEQDLLDMAKSLNVDTFGLKSIEADYNVAITEDEYSVKGSAGLNDTPFATLELAGSKDFKEVYARIPEISDKVLDGSGSITSKDQEALEKLKELKFDEFAPEPKVVEKEMDRYYDVFMDYVVDEKLVKKSSKTIKASGVSEKVTDLKVTLDGDEIADMAVKFCEEVKDDEEIDKYIETIAELMKTTSNSNVKFNMDNFAEDKDEAIDEFIEQIKGSKETLERYKDVVVFHVYVNNKGEVTGSDIAVKGDNNEVVAEVESILAISGNKFGYNCETSIKGETVLEIKGTGSANFSKLDGKFDIEIASDNKKFTAQAKLENCDVTKVLAGEFKGDIILSSDDLMKDAKIKVSIDSEKLDSSIKATVMYDSKEYASLSVTSKYTDKPELVEIDKSAGTVKFDDPNAEKEYLGDFKIEDYVNDYLKKAGIDATSEDISKAFENLFKMFGNDFSGLPIPNDDKFNVAPEPESETDEYSLPTEPETYEWETQEQESETSDLPKYDENYWETYEETSFNKEYWETYEIPTFDEDYFETYTFTGNVN